MKIVIHRGTHEIGGNCIEVSSGTTRVVLDLGVPLVKPDGDTFDPKSLEGKTTEALIAEKIIPDLSGLFTEGDPPDAILLSHSHLDHSGLLHLSRPEIPIYATSGTSKMMLAGAVFGRQKELDKTRHRKVTPGQPFSIGNLTITPFAVDHSSFGSVAYLIEGEGKSLLYSGDLRLHGRKPGMARDMVRQVSSRPIDMLLMEGTHFGSERSKGITEYELEEIMVDHFKAAPSLVFACFSPIDVDRLVTYYRASQRSNRIFVADAYTAFVMHLVASEAAIPRPTSDAGIRVYFNKAFESREISRLKELFKADQILLDEILENPAGHVMAFRPSMAELDFADSLPAQSRCLYSYWKGYLERADWVKLQQTVARAEGDFIPAHASGHIYVDDIVKLVHAINPRQIVPIHTFDPVGFQKHFTNVRLLNDREAYSIA